MNFSLEIGPKTETDTVPALSDVYITMLPGGDYRETADKAVELEKKGFNPVHHFPARSMRDEKELKDYVSRCKGGGCLLYTSPSPRDRTRARMPSSA